MKESGGGAGATANSDEGNVITRQMHDGERRQSRGNLPPKSEKAASWRESS